jgi:anaerobic C4-dicarboxylate transporter
MPNSWLAWLGVVGLIVAIIAGIVAGIGKELRKTIDDMERDPEYQKRVEASKAEEERKRKWRERRDS